MPRYRTKPRQIEAFQWVGQPWDSFSEEFQVWTAENGLALTCYTKQGPVRAEKGDWLIMGQDEVYPCKPDEFDQRYETVDG